MRAATRSAAAARSSGAISPMTAGSSWSSSSEWPVIPQNASLAYTIRPSRVRTNPSPRSLIAERMLSLRRVCAARASRSRARSSADATETAYSPRRVTSSPPNTGVKLPGTMTIIPGSPRSGSGATAAMPSPPGPVVTSRAPPLGSRVTSSAAVASSTSRAASSCRPGPRSRPRSAPTSRSAQSREWSASCPGSLSRSSAAVARRSADSSRSRHSRRSQPGGAKPT